MFMWQKNYSNRLKLLEIKLSKVNLPNLLQLLFITIETDRVFIIALALAVN